VAIAAGADDAPGSRPSPWPEPWPRESCRAPWQASTRPCTTPIPGRRPRCRHPRRADRRPHRHRRPESGIHRLLRRRRRRRPCRASRSPRRLRRRTRRARSPRRRPPTPGQAHHPAPSRHRAPVRTCPPLGHPPPRHHHPGITAQAPARSGAPPRVPAAQDREHGDHETGSFLRSRRTAMRQPARLTSRGRPSREPEGPGAPRHIDREPGGARRLLAAPGVSAHAPDADRPALPAGVTGHRCRQPAGRPRRLPALRPPAPRLPQQRPPPSRRWLDQPQRSPP
jgi:hypothetical protein